MTTITTQQHNRHTEECTSCGAWPSERHDDDCRGHLGTGIRHHRRARQYLRRKFGDTPAEPIVSRPGHLFYVTARSGKRVAWLLGPYVSHMTALGNINRAWHLLYERYPDDAEWVAVGTASRLGTVATKLGR